MIKIVPMGDYYVWYCAWCDTRNMTLWARLDEDVVCGACQQKVTGLTAVGGAA